MTVNDGGTSNNVVTRSFTVTVNPVNQAPTISSMTNLITAMDTATPPIPFVVGDAETAASNLTLSASSSNPLVVSNANIVFGGGGSNRTVTITPSLSQTGYAAITITVSDGSATADSVFGLNVQARPAPPGNLQLILTGQGSVTPNLNAQTLTLGKTYTVTAVPATGQEFAGWTGSLTSSEPKLSFVLTSNLVLQANFIASPYIPVKGTYNGLFYQSDGVRQSSAGCFTLSVTARGTYSGRLQIGKKGYSFKGKLNLQCQATNIIKTSKTNFLTAQLNLASGAQADQILGSVTDGSWMSTLLGDRAVFNTKTNPAPYAGQLHVYPARPGC